MKIHPVIKGYYESKTTGEYDELELELLVHEYGEAFLLNLIAKVCKKKHEREVVYVHDWNREGIKKVA